MNTAAKGTAAELRVAAYLQERGWLVGSRRHIGGAGDLVAVKVNESEWPEDDDLHLVRLIEVKADKKSPWQNFRKADRAALLKTADEHKAEPLLAWSPTPSRIQFIPPKDWP